MWACLNWLVSGNCTALRPSCVRSSAEVWRIKSLIIAHFYTFPCPPPPVLLFASSRHPHPLSPSLFSPSRGGVMGGCHVWINQGMMTSLPSTVTIATPANREMPLSSPWLSTCPVSIPPSFLQSLPDALPVPTLSVSCPQLMYLSIILSLSPLLPLVLLRSNVSSQTDDTRFSH